MMSYFPWLKIILVALLVVFAGSLIFFLPHKENKIVRSTPRPGPSQEKLYPKSFLFQLKRKKKESNRTISIISKTHNGIVNESG